MRKRIEEEFVLLRQTYSEVVHSGEGGEDWFYLPRYPLNSGWQLGNDFVEYIPISFLIKADYPGNPPYGFLTPKGLTFKGTVPNNTGAPPKAVPFPGDWFHFSWTVENWAATSEVQKGSNLVAWCRSFSTRFSEGV